jgi:hypothetical protein
MATHKRARNGDDTEKNETGAAKRRNGNAFGTLGTIPPGYHAAGFERPRDVRRFLTRTNPDPNPNPRAFGRLPAELLCGVAQWHPNLSHEIRTLDTKSRRAMQYGHGWAGKNKAYTVTVDNVDRILNSVRPVGPNAPGKVGVKLILNGFPLALREKMTTLYEAANVLALSITFQEADVKQYFSGVSGGFRPSTVDLIDDTLCELSSFAPLLEELKLDFTALGDGSKDFETSSYAHLLEPTGEETPSINCKVGFAGCRALARLSRAAPHLHTLSLQLDGNEIGDAGLDVLATSLNLPHLKELYLGLKNNNIGPDGIWPLMYGLGKTRKTLHTLHVELEDNRIGNDGAVMLAEIGRFVHTLRLGCKYNGIGDEGANALYKLPRSEVLRHIDLNLDRNLLGFDSVILINRMQMYQNGRQQIQVSVKDNNPWHGHPLAIRLPLGFLHESAFGLGRLVGGSRWV